MKQLYLIYNVLKYSYSKAVSGIVKITTIFGELREYRIQHILHGINCYFRVFFRQHVRKKTLQKRIYKFAYAVCFNINFNGRYMV